MDHKKNSPDTVEFPLTIDQKYHKLIIKFELTYASVYASSRENDAILLCLLTDELRKQGFFLHTYRLQPVKTISTFRPWI